MNVLPRHTAVIVFLCFASAYFLSALVRAVTATLAVRENFHIHDESSDSGGGGVSASFNSRSRLTRAASTSIVSARLL